MSENMRHEEGQQERFAAHLLAWYAQEGRHLPWREQITPYRTWVSENHAAANACGGSDPLF